MADASAVVNYVRFIIQVCKGIVRSHRVRRTLMFYDVLVVLVLMFLGSTFFWEWLRAHPVWFLGYWAVCGWLTILAALLAVYDLLRVRLEARQAEHRLHEEYFPRKENSEAPHDSHQD